MKAPKYPDPKETAAAQTGMNRDTAISQQLLNMNNQYGPDGSVEYDQNGFNTFVGSDGKTVTIPRFNQRTTLSDWQRKIKEQSDLATFNVGKMAADQTGRLGQFLSRPFSLNESALPSLTTDFSADRQRVEDTLMARLNPQISRDQEALRTRLSNQGIKLGSDAFATGMDESTRAANDARLAAILAGGQEQSRLTQLNNSTRAQGVQEQFAMRNQPLNEIGALMSGGQVTMPQFQQTPQTGVAGVDYTGLVGDKYKADSAAYQSKMGGLFGLLSGGIGLFSDRRLKRDIKRVGTLDNGLPVYAYRYVSGGPVQIGVMADDVETIKPEAVSIHPNGFKMVNYGMATEAA